LIWSLSLTHTHTHTHTHTYIYIYIYITEIYYVNYFLILNNIILFKKIRLNYNILCQISDTLQYKHAYQEKLHITIWGYPVIGWIHTCVLEEFQWGDAIGKIIA